MNFGEKNDGDDRNQSGRGRGRGRGRGHGRGRGRHDQNQNQNYESRNPRSRGRGGYNQKVEKKDVQCYNCSRYGHYSYECPDEPKERSHYAEEKKEVDDTVLLAHKGPNEDKEHTWYLDTGASNHMCGHRHIFVEVDESVTGNITFGDHSKIPVKGKGKIMIKLKNGGHQYISNVYYVPGMKTNILSMGQLLEKGYDIHMRDRSLYMRDAKGKLLAHVPMTENRMFLMNIKVDMPKCLKSSFEEDSWMWHLRLGHLNFGGLKLLSTKKMVKGLPLINQPDQFCEGCLVGKQHRQSFPKESMSRANGPLELIHTDVCGPIDPVSLGGNKYFLLFIDDYSRKTWVYFLKNKSEVFSAFKKFKALVEKQSGYQIKAMRSDRGGEFTSNEFIAFCDENGIRRPLTVPYSPQQNGVAERKNRTILNMTRSMLKSKNLPKEFWAEAVECAVYLLNRCPSRSVWKQTPQGAWSGYTPSVSHLKVFGSLAHAHVSEQHRKKLDDRSEKYIFVGYSRQSKGYKLYDPVEKKMKVSRDVLIDENSSWNWSAEAKEQFMFYPTEVDKNRINETIEPEPSPPPTPPSSSGPESSSQNSTSSEDDENDIGPRGARSLEEIYELTQNQTLFCLFADSESLNFEEASKSGELRKAMDEEIHAIKKNNTWELTTLPTGHKPIGVKWVYKKEKRSRSYEINSG